MNDNTIRYPVPPADSLDEAVRANPINAVLIAVGIGFAVAVLLKAAQPSRLQSLLEELEDRLQAVAKPAVRRASSLAERGVALLGSARGDARSLVERAIRDGRGHWKSLFA